MAQYQNKAAFSYRVPEPINGYDTTLPFPPYNINSLQPSYQQKEQSLIRWINQVYKEGMTTLTSEPAWRFIQKSIDYIYRNKNLEVHSATSQLEIPQTERDLEEIVATYANIRPIPDFQGPEDKKATTRILNDLYMDWHVTNSADRWYRKAMQSAAWKGTGWLSPRWTKTNLGVSGEGRITIDIYDHKSVVPIQLGADKEIQNGYGCIIVNEVPIARAHAMYPTYQDKLIPDRQAPAMVRKAAKRMGRTGSIVLAIFGPSGKVIEEGATSAPCVDLFHVYVKDQSINQSGKQILVGGEGGLGKDNSWAYYVSSYLDAKGDINRIPLSTPYQDLQGNWITDRQVTREECLIYPRGRLIISSRTCVLSDGPNPYWHGRFPVSKICFRDLPDTFLGYPLSTGPISIEETINRICRSIENSCIARLNPPLQSDDAIDENLAEKINPSIPGQRWRFNSLLGSGVTFPFEAEYYNVPDFIPKFVEFLYGKMKELLGLGDVQALARARQTPSADSLQKILEMLGPIVEDRSRQVETAITEIGTQLMSHFFQFYDFNKRLRILGPDGVSKEDRDFDPLTLVPETLPGRTRGERAMFFMKSFKFLVTPRSLHEINSLSRKMLYIQLQRAGFPIDSETVGTICDIPRLGTIPGDTVFEKYVNEQMAKVKVGIQLQKEQQDAVGQSQLPAFALEALQQLLAGSVNPNGHPGPGQPSSGQESPQVVEKDGGSRTTISESGR